MSEKRLPTELGTDSIGKLLKKYAIPSIIAMTASSIYNMVDSIFIGQGVGPLAISGLAITFPLMNISTAFGAMVGMGASTLISVKLGQRDYSTAQHILGTAFVLNVLVGVLLGGLALLFLDPILYFFGASDATIGYAREYMMVILLGNVITHLYFGFNAILRSSGHPKFAMTATIATVVVNAILDPIFIFAFHWGIRGAAIATVVAQAVSLVWQFKVLTNKNELIHLRKGIYRLKQKIVGEIFLIGLSPCLMNLASCFVVILINRGLLQYGGDYAVGAFGIIHKLTFLFVMIVMGLNQGMQPIAGFNYGAGLYPRVNEVLKKTILWSTLVMIVGFVVGMFFPDYAARAFTNDEAMIRMAAFGMQINCLFFPIVGFQMVTGNFFQSIAMPGKAIFLSLSRQLLFLVPFLLVFPHFWGLTGVWLSLPASDLISAITAGVMLALHFKKHRNLPSNTTTV